VAVRSEKLEGAPFTETWALNSASGCRCLEFPPIPYFERFSTERHKRAMSPTTKMTISLGPTEDMLFPLAARLIRGGGGDFAQKLSQTKPCESRSCFGLASENAHGTP
jgi:hypothetical protein